MSVLSAISERDRKTLIGGLLAMAAMLGGSRGVPAWREWDEQSRASAEESSAELASLQIQLGQIPALRDSARARTSRAAIGRERLIEAMTVPVAGASLATRVTDMADDLGIKVNAVQIRPDSVFRAGYARVAVTLSATGDVTHLTDLLESIEASDALLALREVTIASADVLAPDVKPELLRFQLLIEGLAVKGKSETLEAGKGAAEKSGAVKATR